MFKNNGSVNKFFILYVLVLTVLFFMNLISMQVPILSDFVFDGLVTFKKLGLYSLSRKFCKNS